MLTIPTSMKTHSIRLLTALALAAAPMALRAEREVVIRQLDTDAPHPGPGVPRDDLREMEKLTFLGVETAPVSRTLGAQLGLAKDMGLAVVNVMDKSPAAEVLKEDDVLTKLDDQLLVNMPQLGALVRAKKEGEEVRLTVVRAGKELTVKVKLASREQPRHANAFFFHHGRPGGAGELGLNFPEGPEELEQLRELPGVGPDGARDVLRMIDRERRSVLSGPPLRIIGRAGRGSTIVDLPKSNISYSDDEGSIDIKVDDGKRNLTIKNAKGEVAFTGPINNEGDRNKLPPEIRHRLEKLETDAMSYEVGGDFKPDVLPLPPETAKTKIGYAPDVDPAPGPGADARPF
jgi:hypothetical protein